MGKRVKHELEKNYLVLRGVAREKGITKVTVLDDGMDYIVMFEHKQHHLIDLFFNQVLMPLMTGFEPSIPVKLKIYRKKYLRIELY